MFLHLTITFFLYNTHVMYWKLFSLNDDFQSKKKKQVRFSTHQHVILIPTRHEYGTELLKTMFYSHMDLQKLRMLDYHRQLQERQISVPISLQPSFRFRTRRPLL